MSSIVVNHQHCRVCGRAMPIGKEKICSPECQKEVDVVQRKRRNLLWFIYGMIGVSIAFLLLQLGVFGG